MPTHLVQLGGLSGRAPGLTAAGEVLVLVGVDQRQDDEEGVVRVVQRCSADKLRGGINSHHGEERVGGINSHYGE